MTLFIWNVQNRQIHREDKYLSGLGGGRGVECDCWWLQGSFLGWWNVLELDSGDAWTTLWLCF